MKPCFAVPLKRRFKIKASAQRSAQLAYEQTGVMISVYKCPCCGDFHLTRQGDGYELKFKN